MSTLSVAALGAQQQSRAAAQERTPTQPPNVLAPRPWRRQLATSAGSESVTGPPRPPGFRGRGGAGLRPRRDLCCVRAGGRAASLCPSPPSPSSLPVPTVESPWCLPAFSRTVMGCGILHTREALVSRDVRWTPDCPHLPHGDTYPRGEGRCTRRTSGASLPVRHSRQKVVPTQATLPLGSSQSILQGPACVWCVTQVTLFFLRRGLL